MKTYLSHISPKAWSVLVLLGLLIGGGVYAQLQQSGGPGSTVTANAGTNLNTSALALETGGNLATIAGTVSAAKVNVTGTITAVTAITNALPAGANVIGHVITDSGTITAVTAITNALPAGTNVIGHVIADSGLINTVPKTSCGNALATGSTLAAVPTSPTLLTSAATACVTTATFFNTNGSAATVTLTDNTGTPINAMLTFSIPANSNVIEPLGGGAFNAGVKWTASTTGVTGYVVAYQ